MTSKEAMDHLRQAFQKHSDYAMSWHRNLACCALDEGVDHKTANLIASRFMKLAFEVVTEEPPTSKDNQE